MQELNKIENILCALSPCVHKDDCTDNPKVPFFRTHTRNGSYTFDIGRKPCFIGSRQFRIDFFGMYPQSCGDDYDKAIEQSKEQQMMFVAQGFKVVEQLQKLYGYNVSNISDTVYKGVVSENCYVSIAFIFTINNIKPSLLLPDSVVDYDKLGFVKDWQGKYKPNAV